MNAILNHTKRQGKTMTFRKRDGFPSVFDEALDRPKDNPAFVLCSWLPPVEGAPEQRAPRRKAQIYTPAL